jgi:hypothetical protein
MTTLFEMQREAEKDTTQRRQLFRLREMKVRRELDKGNQRRLI